MRWRVTIMIEVTLGAAALTKVSGLMLLPVAALALTLEALRTATGAPGWFAGWP